MGNGITKLTVCFTGDTTHRRLLNNNNINVFISPDQLIDGGLGHSFCYVRPDSARLSSSKVHHSDESSTTTTTFHTISGASLSANTSTTATAATYVDTTASAAAASAFESSTSFASIPLHPIPKNLLAEYSGPLSGLIPSSGPMDRGFMSGPIERAGFMSGPIMESAQFQRSFSVSYNSKKRTKESRKQRIIRALTNAIKTMSFSQNSNSVVAPVRNGPDRSSEFMNPNNENNNYLTMSSSDGSLLFCDDDDDLVEKSQSLHWAQGKAGEDRVHVVVSEEHGWVFVGIYDGFSGPDAPDFLLSNLYLQVHRELKGLLWDDEKLENGSPVLEVDEIRGSRENGEERVEESEGEKLEKLESGLKRKGRSLKKGGKYRENQIRWRCEWDRERLELDKKLKDQLNKNQDTERIGSMINHGDVLKALSQALNKTEDSYLDIADKMLMENPELSLMGSCVLVMLMKGEDVYVMNVGDSRAVLAQKAEPDYGLGKSRQDLERINEETLRDLEAFDGERSGLMPSLNAIQLSVDHSTSVDEEVQRIRNEHPDDARAIVNNRVKGSLKVTRAFGAGFLKRRKWNEALLERFRIDYVGNSPYISCSPSLYHHRLGPKDRFLLLSSDGLYQYLTNEEAVCEVELFIALQPEGDPAQHLVEEVLFRAAKKAGMDFHELLDIPQGDRRRYHDDISIIVISLEGRIWRSCI